MALRSLKTFARPATLATCSSAPVTASPTTTRTGSLCGCPNGTGSASVTTARPFRTTSGPGRAWASARPGAMTM